MSPFILDADVPRICTEEAWLLGVLFCVVNGILFLGALCCTCLHRCSFQPTHTASQHLLQFNLKSLTCYYSEGLGVAWKPEVFTRLTFFHIIFEEVRWDGSLHQFFGGNHSVYTSVLLRILDLSLFPAPVPTDDPWCNCPPLPQCFGTMSKSSVFTVSLFKIRVHFNCFNHS